MTEYWWESQGFSDDDILIHRTCPVCDSPEMHEYQAAGYADVPWQICVMCKYIMQSPYPSMESMKLYYASDYRTEVSKDYPTAHDIRIQGARAVRQLEAWHRAKGPRPYAMLDIGAANGRLLEHFKAYYRDLTIMACEYNQADLDLMKAKHIPHTDDYEGIKGHYDLITMSHVLEHIDRPVEYLRDIRARLTTAQAWMLIETPSTGSTSAYQSFHMGVYSWLSTVTAFTRAGWVVSWLEQTTPKLQTCVARLTA